MCEGPHGLNSVIRRCTHRLCAYVCVPPINLFHTSTKLRQATEYVWIVSPERTPEVKQNAARPWCPQLSIHASIWEYMLMLQHGECTDPKSFLNPTKKIGTCYNSRLTHGFIMTNALIAYGCNAQVSRYFWPFAIIAGGNRWESKAEMICCFAFLKLIKCFVTKHAAWCVHSIYSHFCSI